MSVPLPPDKRELRANRYSLTGYGFLFACFRDLSRESRHCQSTSLYINTYFSRLLTSYGKRPKNCRHGCSRVKLFASRPRPIAVYPSGRARKVHRMTPSSYIPISVAPGRTRRLSTYISCASIHYYMYVRLHPNYRRRSFSEPETKVSCVV